MSEVLIHIHSQVTTFNLSLTSFKGVALTCVSVFYLLFEVEPPDLCVCPVFNALTFSGLPLTPFKKLNPQPLDSYLEFLSTSSMWKGPYTFLVKSWPTLSPGLTPLEQHMQHVCVHVCCVCVCVYIQLFLCVYKRMRVRETERQDEKMQEQG